LFGFKGRNGAKIFSKQIEVSNNIKKILQDCLITEDKSLLVDLISKMLDINYKTRISPEEALKHEFFQNITSN